MNKFLLIFLLPLAALGQGFTNVAVMAGRTNGELMAPSNFFIKGIIGGSNMVVVATNNGIGWKLILNSAASGGGVDGSANSNLSYAIGAAATNFTLGASNGVRLVAGADATNHANAILQSGTNYANGVTNSSIVRQVELTSASNAVVSYANGVTNSSIVRQTQLTTASNALVTYANSVTNSSIVRQAELTAASNAVVSYANGVTNSSIVRQLELTAASNSLVTYANSVTNSSIVRQPELTAASNALLAVTYAVGANATNYANGITNSSIVRQAELTAASNALVSFSIGTTNSSIVRQAELTAASNAVIAYANGVTNSSIVRQAELTAASNALINVTNSLVWTNGQFPNLSFLSLADGQTPIWNAAAEMWTNGTPAAGSAQLGATNFALANVTNYSQITWSSNVVSAGSDGAFGAYTETNFISFSPTNKMCQDLTLTNNVLWLFPTNMPVGGSRFVQIAITPAHHWIATNRVVIFPAQFKVFSGSYTNTLWSNATAIVTLQAMENSIGAIRAWYVPQNL